MSLCSRNNLGKAYDQEEDPDFDEIESASEDFNDSFDEESDILESDEIDDETEEVIKVKDANAEGSMIEDLSVMVEDLKIPDEVGNEDNDDENEVDNYDNDHENEDDDDDNESDEEVDFTDEDDDDETEGEEELSFPEQLT